MRVLVGAIFRMYHSIRLGAWEASLRAFTCRSSSERALQRLMWGVPSHTGTAPDKIPHWSAASKAPILGILTRISLRGTMGS